MSEPANAADEASTSDLAAKYKDDDDKERNVQAKLLRLQEENIRLRSVIQGVTDVNKRWQKYNQERQGYVQKLLSTIKELQQRELNDSGSSSNDELFILQGKHDHLKLENMVLHKELVEHEKNCRHLTAKLELAKHDFAEQLQVLDMQVKMHKDDWEAERREKDDARQTSERLRAEVESLKVKLAAQKQDVRNKRHSNSHNDLRFLTATGRSRTCTQDGGTIIGASECQASKPATNGNTVKKAPIRAHHSVDSVLTSSSSGMSTSSSSSPSTSPVATGNYYLVPHKTATSKSDSWKLVCPRCRRVFPANLQLQFTSHLDECQENMHTCSQ